MEPIYSEHFHSYGESSTPRKFGTSFGDNEIIIEDLPKQGHPTMRIVFDKNSLDIKSFEQHHTHEGVLTSDRWEYNKKPEADKFEIKRISKTGKMDSKIEMQEADPYAQYYTVHAPHYKYLEEALETLTFTHPAIGEQLLRRYEPIKNAILGVLNFAPNIDPTTGENPQKAAFLRPGRVI